MREEIKCLTFPSITDTFYKTNCIMEGFFIMYATFWSLVPPVVAIVLALITKEVYSSLFVGIATAALFYAQFHIVDAYTTMFRDGFIASLSEF